MLAGQNPNKYLQKKKNPHSAEEMGNSRTLRTGLPVVVLWEEFQSQILTHTQKTNFPKGTEAYHERHPCILLLLAGGLQTFRYDGHKIYFTHFHKIQFYERLNEISTKGSAILACPERQRYVVALTRHQ